MQLEQATKTSLKPTTHFSFNQSEVITLVSEIITCGPSNNLFLLLASKEMNINRRPVIQDAILLT